MTPLSDPAFLAELDALRGQLRLAGASGKWGDRASPRRGGTGEFAEHRAYAPGDDLRRLDWTKLARGHAPVVKVHRAEEDIIVRLLVDASASMDYGTPSKLDRARRFAAAIGYLALTGSERAQVVALGARHAERRVAAGPIRRGRQAIAPLFGDLARLGPARSLDLFTAIETVVRSSRRPGLLMIASDFMHPAPLDGALRRARFAGHDVALVHVIAREEIEPPFDGDVALVDAETGEVVEATVDVAALDAYRRRLSAIEERLRAQARAEHLSYTRLSPERSLARAARRFVTRSID